MSVMSFDINFDDRGSLQKITSQIDKAKSECFELRTSANEAFSGLCMSDDVLSLPLSQYSKDLSYLNRWLANNEMIEYSDMSFADVKNLLSELEFSLRNLNDSVLKGFDVDGKSITDPLRWMRDHEGKLEATLTESDVENLVSDLKKLQQLRDILGAMLGVESEPNRIQTKIEKRRKYLDKVGEPDFEPPIDVSMSLEDIKKARKWFDKALLASTGDAYDYYSKQQYELSKRERSLKMRKKLPEMEEEVAKLDSMEGKTLTLELKTIGLDGVKKRIKELKDMLADTKNPLGDEQRKEVIKLIQTWGKYEKVLKKSSVKFSDAWAGIKGIGGGVESITDALNGNGNAWQMITGVVDGAIQIYDGVKGVIQIIDDLSAALGLSNAVTAASGAAAVTAASAKTAAAPEEVAASSATMAAVKAEAMAYRELAASEFMAAHAFIPFALSLIHI